jgi:hypothetical protein
MKYVHFDHTNQLRVPATSYVRARTWHADCPKARMMTDAVLVGVAIAILALYAAMFLGLYRWGHYAPLLPPDSTTAARAMLNVRQLSSRCEAAWHLLGYSIFQVRMNEKC